MASERWWGQTDRDIIGYSGGIIGHMQARVDRTNGSTIGYLEGKWIYGAGGKHLHP
jgi:hypothetical protein